MRDVLLKADEKDPAVALLQRVATAERRNRHYNIAMLVIVALTCVTLVVTNQLWNAHTGGTVDRVRTSQVANIAHGNAVAACELRGFNTVVDIIDLALKGDKNPADYPQVVKCAAIPMHRRYR